MSKVTAALVKELRERTGLPMMECKKALVEADGDMELAIENLRKSSGMKAAKKSCRTAADGVAAIKIADDNSKAVLLEVNSETDFVARDENFLGFVNTVLDAAFKGSVATVGELMDADLEAKREALVQKIGENISVRRLYRVAADNGVVGSYVHGNKKIAVVTVLQGGDAELARDVAMHIAAMNSQFVSPDDVSQDLIAKEREIYTVQAQDSGKPAEIIEKMVDGRVRKFLAEVSLTEQAFVKDPDVKVGKLVEKAGAKVLSFERFEVGEGIEKEEVDFATEVAAQLKSDD
ncbi:MAG: translation elongation factor Ts [Pseudomonadales bacterium]